MRNIGLIIVFVIGVTLSAVVWAQNAPVRPQKNENNLQPLDDQSQAKMMMQSKKPKMCPACTMMMQAMTVRQMVATSDGGVVLWLGQKLVKYDKDLNLVKESDVSLKADDQYAKFIEGRKDCSMCQKMKETTGCPHSSPESAPVSQGKVQMSEQSHP